MVATFHTDQTSDLIAPVPAPPPPSSACRHLLPDGEKREIGVGLPYFSLAVAAAAPHGLFSPSGRRCRQADEGGFATSTHRRGEAVP
ncbi:hypothetical protein GGQ64_001198 [Rhizobium azooxidifex]|uniref:Uncharacterized protein n=1 Tax=Mycoplana azooxidifex TaxID=1636188 RepID=A0A7W6D3D2_9HYPH|nr:hypothetical protein [Mycoplana azooxidifex]